MTLSDAEASILAAERAQGVMEALTARPTLDVDVVVRLGSIISPIPSDDKQPLTTVDWLKAKEC